MIRNVLILGGGSAGLIAAVTLKARLPSLPITVLRSKELGIIGVGEATTFTTPMHLHGYVGIDLAEFYREVRPCWKLGIRFLWGKRPYFNYTFQTLFDSQYQALSRGTGYYAEEGDWRDWSVASALMTRNKAFVRQPNGAPLIGTDVAYHLENETFVGFLEKYATRQGIVVRDGLVDEVRQNEQGVASLKLTSGEEISADLYLDCSGFRSLLLGKTLGTPFRDFKRTLYCDSAVIGGWMRGPEEPIKPYTTAESLSSGWCWRIDHEDRINRGYVFSSSFQSDDDAEREFRALCPKVAETRIIRLVTGRHEATWVKNVVAVGNAGGFVEPLESTALGMICADSQAIAEVLHDCEMQPTPSQVRAFNLRTQRGWDALRNFLGIHYRFNTRYDTPFWKACRETVDIGDAERLVEYYRENGPSPVWRDMLIDSWDQFKLDGYWTLLIGQEVPHMKRFEPTPSERETITKIHAKLDEVARQAYTAEETFKIIRSPQWQWDPNFYREQLRNVPGLARRSS